MNHQAARDLITLVLRPLLGGQLNQAAIDFCTAWGACESSYGEGWKAGGPMAQSHNWGALQKGSSWTGPTAVTKDTYVDKNGKTQVYTSHYRIYSTHLEGAADMCRLLVNGYGGRALPFILSGDILGACRALRVHRNAANKGQDLDSRVGYYEGHGPTPDARERNRAAEVYAAIIRANLAISPTAPLPDGTPTPATLKPGFIHPAQSLTRLKKALGLPLVPVAAYPRIEVSEWQETFNLTQDGVTGPTTWGYLIAYREQGQREGGTHAGGD